MHARQVLYYTPAPYFAPNLKIFCLLSFSEFKNMNFKPDYQHNTKEHGEHLHRIGMQSV